MATLTVWKYDSPTGAESGLQNQFLVSGGRGVECFNEEVLALECGRQGGEAGVVNCHNRHAGRDGSFAVGTGDARHLKASRKEGWHDGFS